MGHKCFISFKTEDYKYKESIQNHPEIDIIDKSLNDAIDSEDEDYIMRKIRKNHLSDSTVTIHLIGSRSSENVGYEQRYIKRELQASLYHGADNTRNGILGVVLPDSYNTIYKGTYTCSCGITCGSVFINDQTVVKEFSRNYYIPEIGKCHWSEDERYCVLVKWEDFIEDPNKYIDLAFEKRFADVRQKVTVYPK